MGSEPDHLSEETEGNLPGQEGQHVGADISVPRNSNQGVPQEEPPGDGITDGPMYGPEPLPGFTEFLEENYYNEGAPFEVALWYWEAMGMQGAMPDVTQYFPDYLPGAKEQLNEWAEVEARETAM